MGIREYTNASGNRLLVDLAVARWELIYGTYDHGVGFSTLPSLHCLNFEVFLILGCSAQPEDFGITDETVVRSDCFYISCICALLKNDTLKTDMPIRCCQECIRIL